jgi:hypothetical protein
MPVRLRYFQNIRLSAFSAASVLRMMACTKKKDSPTNAVPMKVSVEAAGQRDVPPDDIRPYHACSGGTTTLVLRCLSRPSRFLATLLLSLSFTSLASSTLAQSSEDAGRDTPLISGAAAFFTRTNGRKTTYSPVLAPLLAAPVGTHLLFESRAALAETWSPTGPNNTYDHAHFVGLTYAQVDYFLNALLVHGGLRNVKPAELRLQTALYNLFATNLSGWSNRERKAAIPFVPSRNRNAS